MIWFDSSAGVALSNMCPGAKSVGLWLRDGWFVALAYVTGVFVMLAVIGWRPDTKGLRAADSAPIATTGVVNASN